MDQTGGFPITSRRGNKYLMVLYDYNTNAILVTAIKNRTKDQLITGYNKLYGVLQKASTQPELQRLNNKTSKELIAEMINKGLKYQVVSSGDHQ